MLLKQRNKKIIAMILIFILMIGVIATVSFAGGVGNHISNSGSSSGSSSSTTRRSSSSSGSDSIIAALIINLLFSPFGILLIILYGVGFILKKNDLSENKIAKYIIKYHDGINKVVRFIKKVNNETNASGRSNQSGGRTLPDNTEEITKAIKKVDPNFSTSKFISWSENVFMKVNKAWTKKDWELIRPFENDHLFELHSDQLQEYIDNKTTNVIKNIAINQSYLYTYDRDDNYEYLKVILKARLISFIRDDRTGEILDDGNENEEVYIDYIMTFMRSNGTKTNPSTSNKSTSRCPNCGGPTNITSSGKCSYCDEIITTGKHDWVLCDFDSVKPDTIEDRTPVTIMESKERPTRNKKEQSKEIKNGICPECKAENKPEDSFCEFCGTKLR